MTHEPKRSRPIVGQIVGTFGLRGAVKVNPLTDFVERFNVGSSLLIDDKPHEVLHLIWHKGQARITFDGIESIEQAEELRWKYIEAQSRDDLVLDEDEYMSDDLVGLQVVDTSGRSLGTVQAVHSRPGHDLLEIDGSLVPAVKEFVKSVDLTARKMTIEPIPGLLSIDEEEAE